MNDSSLFLFFMFILYKKSSPDLCTDIHILKVCALWYNSFEKLYYHFIFYPASLATSQVKLNTWNNFSRPSEVLSLPRNAKQTFLVLFVQQQQQHWLETRTNIILTIIHHFIPQYKNKINSSKKKQTNWDG